MDKKRILKFVEEHNGEAVNTPQGIVFVFPKVQESFKGQITEMWQGSIQEFDLVEGVKPNTMARINEVVQGKVGQARSRNEGRHLILETSTRPGPGQMLLGAMSGGAPQTIPTPEPKMWEEIEDLIVKDGFFESWEFILDGQSSGKQNKDSRRLGSEFARHQELGRLIQKDDLLNLHISLGKIGTVEEFLKEIGA